MKIVAMPSYNYDIVCLANTFTADDYYLKWHREAFDRFYPLLSDSVKNGIAAFVKSTGRILLSASVTLFLSAASGANELDTCELLQAKDEMRECIKKTPYAGGDKRSYDELFDFMSGVLVPMVRELEAHGFKEYWEQSRLPLIAEKCEQINNWIAKYDISKLLSKYLEKLNDDDITAYICSYTRPHGIKMCGNAMICDYTWSDSSVLEVVTHEMFHPPYNHDEVKEYVDAIAQKQWFIDAFNKQNNSVGYDSIEGFVEENIVEALGTMIVHKLDLVNEPFKYFEEHDGGSHVLSPYFFRFLQAQYDTNNGKSQQLFVDFARDIDKWTAR